MEPEPPDLQRMLEEAVEEFRRRANQEVDLFLNRKRAAEESDKERKKQRIEEGRAALARAFEAARTPATSQLFLSSIVQIRVEGQLVNLHASVAHKFPYFATLLSGRWNEADVLDLNLPEPCGLEDFLVLVRRVYSAEHVPVVFESLGSALRVALVASMLLVDDQTLAEIAVALAHTVMTKEQVIAFRSFVQHYQLPAAFATIFSSEEVAPIDVDDFKQMVASTAACNDRQQQEFAEKIVASQVSFEHKQALCEAVEWPEHGCKCYLPNLGSAWWLDMVMKHASADQVMTVLFKISNVAGPCCENCVGDVSFVQCLRNSFFAYARKARTHEVDLIGICTQGHAFSFSNSAEGLQLLSEALRRPGSTMIVRKMAECAPSILVGLLSQQVLNAIPDQKKIIDKLCSNRTVLRNWATSEQLNALPLDSRVAVCSTLVSQMSMLSNDVLQVLRATL